MTTALYVALAIAGAACVALARAVHERRRGDRAVRPRTVADHLSEKSNVIPLRERGENRRKRA